MANSSRRVSATRALETAIPHRKGTGRAPRAPFPTISLYTGETKCPLLSNPINSETTQEYNPTKQ